MTIIDEYPEEYCLALECAYGQGMMSEGGDQGIEKMFSGIALSGKSALDIGCGLGGVAFYLASHHNMHVTGAEINPWMVAESTRRITRPLENRLNFVHLDSAHFPFENSQFDLVYSKGVFTHISDKINLFQEIFRVLKPSGQLLIMDWLSPIKNKWGPIITQMAETENLTLFAESDESYSLGLKQAGFDNIVMRDESDTYACYNHKISQSLQSNKKEDFIKRYGRKTLEEHASGYELIAKAIEAKEVLVRHFTAQKPT